MRGTRALGGVLIELFVACGGGKTPTAPSSPASATTPTAPPPTSSTITVYASHDLAVVFSSSDPGRADETEPSFMMNHVGWSYTLDASKAVSSIGWGLAFRFDIQSQVAGHEVSKATFCIDMGDLWVRPDLSVAPQIRVNAFENDWNPGYLTWNTWLGLACRSAGEAQAATPSKAGPLDFDVTEIVRNWASGAWGNYGLKAMVEDSYPGHASNGITSFYSLGSYNAESQRPRLVIEFK